MTTAASRSLAPLSGRVPSNRVDSVGRTLSIVQTDHGPELHATLSCERGAHVQVTVLDDAQVEVLAELCARFLARPRRTGERIAESDLGAH